MCWAFLFMGLKYISSDLCATNLGQRRTDTTESLRTDTEKTLVALIVALSKLIEISLSWLGITSMQQVDFHVKLLITPEKGKCPSQKSGNRITSQGGKDE